MLHKDLRVDGKKLPNEEGLEKILQAAHFPRRGRHLLAGCPVRKIFFTMTMVAGTRSRLNCS